MTGKQTDPSKVPRNAVLLANVPSLTFRAHKITSARRLKPVSQLECIGPEDVCSLYSVDMMRCVNEGVDYDAANVQWSCRASLPDEFKLGSTDVVCEGYASSDDPYVLKGSCGVEYRLILTNKGEAKYGRTHQQSQSGKSSVNINIEKATPVFFFIVFGIVLLIILRGIWSNWNQNTHRPGGGGGGGGGGNNNDDPPPPYDDPPSYYGQSHKAKAQKTAPRTSTSTRASSSRTAPRSEQQQQGWRPGFWTGTAAGAAAGYFAGTRGQTQNNTRQPEPATRPETQQRPGSFFSNFGNTRPRAASPSRASEPSSSASTYSSTRYESTGFGETRRR